MRKILVAFNIVLLCVLVFTLVTPSVYGQAKKEKTPTSNRQGQVKGQQTTIGKVEEVQENTVVLEEKQGKKTEVVVDNTTQVLGRDKKPLNLRQIRPKDLIAIVSSESGIATDEAKPNKAIKIFVKEASATATSKRQAVHGLITGINGALITLVHQVQRDRFFNLHTTSQTIVKFKGVLGTTVANLELGMHIVAVGDLSEEGTLATRRIHVIPGKGLGLPELVPPATTSATLTPTPTASESATASDAATPTFTP